MILHTTHICIDDYSQAARRIAPWILHTPCVYSPVLSHATGSEVFLKLENWQHSRSFKLRGAANKMLSLTDQEKENGVVLASTGNHAAACAHMARVLKLKATCVLPQNVTPAKRESAEATDMELLFSGNDCVETEMAAQRLAQEKNAAWVAPYNDPAIIAGQGTIALEIMDALKHVDAVLAPVGGGGLMSGISGAMKALLPGVHIVGCQPLASPVMARSIEKGELISMVSTPTLSDGTAGGIAPDSITFDYCKQNVNQWALLDESAIANAVRLIMEHHHMIIEGAAALPVAALLQSKKQYRNRRTVLVLSGARLHIETLKSILNGENDHDTHLSH